MPKKRVREDVAQGSSSVDTDGTGLAPVPSSLTPEVPGVDTDDNDKAQPAENERSYLPTSSELAQALARRLSEKYEEDNALTDDAICETLLENCIKITLRQFKNLCGALRSGKVEAVQMTLKSTHLFPEQIYGLVKDMASPDYWEKALEPLGGATKQEQRIQEVFQGQGYKVNPVRILGAIENMNHREESLVSVRRLELLATVCKDLEPHVVFDHLIARLRQKCTTFYGQDVFVREGNGATVKNRDPLGGQQNPCQSFNGPSTTRGATQTLVFVGESGCGKTVAMISFPAFLGTLLGIGDIKTFVCYGNHATYLDGYKPLAPDDGTPDWKQRRNDHVLAHIAGRVANGILENLKTNALKDLLMAATERPVCLVVAVDEIGSPSHVDVAHALCSKDASGELQKLLLKYHNLDVTGSGKRPQLRVILAIAGTGLGDGTISPGSEQRFYNIVRPQSKRVFDHLVDDNANLYAAQFLRPLQRDYRLFDIMVGNARLAVAVFAQVKEWPAGFLAWRKTNTGQLVSYVPVPSALHVLRRAAWVYHQYNGL
eukprot:PhM_4_TR17072/c2_g1_i1/m.87214